MVAASWERSRAAGLAIDGRGVRLVHRRLDGWPPTRLSASTRTVLDRAGQRYAGIDTAVLVADASGFIVDARSCAPGIEEWLLDSRITTGLCVDERLVATNALGTALEAGRPVAIAEGEHFLASQRDWVGAGAPIVDPGVHRVVGALALICPHGPYSPLLLAVARQLADEIGDGLADQTDASDRAVIDAFVRARRERKVGILSISRNVMVADRFAQDLLDGIGHGMLWSRARELAAQTPSVGTLYAQAVARRCQVTHTAAGEPDALLLEITALTEPTRSPRRVASVALEGLVGRSKSWAAVATQAAALRGQRHPVLITGEQGTGKTSVAIAIAADRISDAPIDIVDCAEIGVIGPSAWLRAARTAVQSGSSALVVRHLELLDDDAAHALRAIIGMPDTARILATLAPAASQTDALRSLIVHLGVARLEIPPLRRRADDIEPLCTAVVARHSPRGYEPRMTRNTLAALSRYHWPGNVRELDTVVRGMLTRRAIGSLRPEDLPPEIESTLDHLVLTPMQQIERETIAAMLRNRRGNKVAAAAELGIARSTLYRKIRTYRLDIRQVY